jgi:3-oxoadipate enol-lactonase
MTTSRTMQINDITMYYELHGGGNKNPIVMIAGFGCDHTFWTGMLSDLAQKHEVLLLDNRGIGQTDVPEENYSIEQMADDTIKLIRALELKQPVLIGQSMGSAITQILAKQYPNEFSKIVLINTFCCLTKAPEVAFEFTGEIHRLGLSLAERVKSIAGWVYSSAFLSQPNQLENIINMAENYPYPQSLISYKGQLNALKHFDSRVWLHEINMPALIIAAEEDRIASIEEAKLVKKLIGENARLVIIPGGHASPIEHPKLVTQAIKEFLA